MEIKYKNQFWQFQKLKKNLTSLFLFGFEENVPCVKFDVSVKTFRYQENFIVTSLEIIFLNFLLNEKKN